MVTLTDQQGVNMVLKTRVIEDRQGTGMAVALLDQRGVNIQFLRQNSVTGANTVLAPLQGVRRLEGVMRSKIPEQLKKT